MTTQFGTRFVQELGRLLLARPGWRQFSAYSVNCWLHAPSGCEAKAISGRVVRLALGGRLLRLVASPIHDERKRAESVASQLDSAVRLVEEAARKAAYLADYAPTLPKGEASHE